VLERGVAVAPSLGILWHWLATCQSDLADYDAAAASFRRSLELGDVHRSIELFNLALVEQRRGRYDAALHWLDQMAAEDDLGPSPAERFQLRALLHFRAGRPAEAARFLKEAERAPGHDEPQVVKSIASLLAELALAAGKRRTARRMAKAALRIDQRDRAALDVLRRSRARASPRARLWRILVCGRATVDDEHQRFFINYDVVADDAAEAFAYAREVERFVGHRRLGLEESRVLPAAVDGPSGVVAPVGGYVFYRDEAGECDTTV
jgi:tetratricopeptide (TPR) repeat protein